jgi:methylenetetrahydrofolate reductase (NADPH)
VAGACYPEVHPEAGSAEEDLAHLREKVDAGAEFLISQLFFDPEVYFRFASRARDAGITVPIVAGVMPITNLSQVKKFTSLCGATIPAELLSRLEEVSGQPEAVEAVGVEYAIRQCEELLRGGAPGIHFYTLNRSPATRRVLEALRSTGVV